MVAVFTYSNYIGRLMSNGLPAPNTRPGVFISVGRAVEMSVAPTTKVWKNTLMATFAMPINAKPVKDGGVRESSGRSRCSYSVYRCKLHCVVCGRSNSIS